MSEGLDKEAIADLLRGRTMSVYALLLTRDSMGVREVQRELGYSSPNLALHHLTKLVEMGLVSKDAHGNYSVARDVRIGSLSLFIRVGRTLLPRFLFLATFIAGMLVAYIALFAECPPGPRDLMFYGLCAVSLLMVLSESRKLWLLRPL